MWMWRIPRCIALMTFAAALSGFSTCCMAQVDPYEFDLRSVGTVQLRISVYDPGGDMVQQFDTTAWAEGTGRLLYNLVTGEPSQGSFDFSSEGELGDRNWSIRGEGTLEPELFGRGTGQVNPNSLQFSLSGANILGGSGNGSGQYSIYREDNRNPLGTPFFTIFGSGEGSFSYYNTDDDAKSVYTVTVEPFTTPETYLAQATYVREELWQHILSPEYFGVTASAQDNGAMQAVFTPGFKLDQTHAAEAMGFDHFNWLNIVVYTDVPGFEDLIPFADPFKEDADDESWFYDENVPQVYQDFEDAPRFQQAGKTAIFETHLVGIADANPWNFVNAPTGATEDTVFDTNGLGFRWQYTQVDPSGLSSNVFQNDDPSLGVPGEVEFLGWVVYDDEKQAELRDSGFALASDVVPEPSSLILLLVFCVIGTAVYGAGYRRR